MSLSNVDPRGAYMLATHLKCTSLFPTNACASSSNLFFSNKSFYIFKLN